MSVATEFCDTYTTTGTMNNHPAGFILLPLLLKDRRLAEEPEKWVFAPQAKHTKIQEVDGCPAAWIRVRMIHHFRKQKDNVGGIMMALKMLFTEDFIKRQFTMPNIWLLNHNIIARKRATYERQMRAHALKGIPKSDQRLSMEVDRRLQNRSVSTTMREIRSFQQH